MPARTHVGEIDIRWGERIGVLRPEGVPPRLFACRPAPPDRGAAERVTHDYWERKRRGRTTRTARAGWVVRSTGTVRFEITAGERGGVSARAGGRAPETSELGHCQRRLVSHLLPSSLPWDRRVGRLNTGSFDGNRRPGQGAHPESPRR